MLVLIQDLDFRHNMSWSLFVLNDLNQEVVFRFADTGGIVDHHCLNLLFIVFHTLYMNGISHNKCGYYSSVANVKLFQ